MGMHRSCGLQLPIRQRHSVRLIALASIASSKATLTASIPSSAMVARVYTNCAGHRPPNVGDSFHFANTLPHRFESGANNRTPVVMINLHQTLF